MKEQDQSFVIKSEIINSGKIVDLLSNKKSYFEYSLEALTLKVNELRKMEELTSPTESIVNNINENYIENLYLSN